MYLWLQRFFLLMRLRVRVKRTAVVRRFVFDDFLRFHSGVHYSNFPLLLDPYERDGVRREGLVKEAADRWKLDVEEVRRRVQLISKETFDSWCDQSNDDGPWRLFHDVDLSGAHIAIDEVHHCFPSKGMGTRKRKKLLEWLSEIRHCGATVEFLTQHPKNVAAEVLRLVNYELVLVPLEELLDPWFGIRFGDWAELKAKLTGKFQALVREEKWAAYGKKQKRVSARMWVLDAWYFGLYNSHSKPQSGAGQVPKKSMFRAVWLGATRGVVFSP